MTIPIASVENFGSKQYTIILKITIFALGWPGQAHRLGDEGGGGGGGGGSYQMRKLWHLSISVH